MYLPAFQIAMTNLPADPASTPVQYIKGIGPRKSELLKQLGIETVLDLFFYVPRRYLDRSGIVTVARLRHLALSQGGPDLGLTPQNVETGEIRRDYTVVGEIRSFRVVGFGKKARFIVVLADQTGSMQCVWFGGVHYWRKAFQVGETVAVSGQPSLFRSVLQFIHPELDRISPPGNEDTSFSGQAVTDWARLLNTGGLVPLYPSTQELGRSGLDSGGFRRVISLALGTYLDSLRETLPGSILTGRHLTSIRNAVRWAHFPKTGDELAEGLRRLKYEELFYFQLKLGLKRRRLKEETKGISFSSKSVLARRLVDSLPFRLTRAQIRVIKEISADMASPKPMNRLLQGDVGSGKTIVALTAMLIAVDNGYQAGFMAPTEILAEQHFRTLAAFVKDLPVKIRLLVGAQRTTVRRDILDDVRRGTAQIVVGTHALFEKDVAFPKLGLVIIDEQHRFGVMQRAQFRQKGENPDVLVMTATPIPRTLSLTLYGDLDVSVLDELPQGRRPIKTILRQETEKESVYQFVRDQIAGGRQAYFVYPLIEESEKLDLKAATVHLQHLQQEVFPDLRLGLIHGRMTSDEKDHVMHAFKHREIDILVATTVIEVGIDIPNASVMVIENAERFGLSQLHQLRGRVGRGSEQSYCVLLAKTWIARRAQRVQDPAVLQQERDQQRLAERRLATMVSTNDGFVIAETDLQLRGPGDYFGTRQSGLPEFRVANILTDHDVLNQARSDAFELIARDPQLTLAEHRVLADRLRAHFKEELPLLQVG